MCQYLLATEIIVGMLETAQHTITEEHSHQNYRELYLALDLHRGKTDAITVSTCSHASQTFHHTAKNCLLSWEDAI